TTTTTTTPITATANTTVASTTGTVDRGAFNNQAQVRTTMPNGSKSTTSTSLWSRIINSISTFFSKFF
ncbi:MAG: hypothetical protein ACXVNF_02390, partial [Neobacillus sp.]